MINFKQVAEEFYNLKLNNLKYLIFILEMRNEITSNRRKLEVIGFISDEEYIIL